MSIGRTDVETETAILWPPDMKSWLIGKDPDTDWERLRAGGEGDDRGWDGWMASPTQWTWVWVNSGSWWWTGRPGVLWFMGSQRVRHDWVTDLNWTNITILNSKIQLCIRLISPESRLWGWDLHAKLILGNAPKNYNTAGLQHCSCNVTSELRPENNMRSSCFHRYIIFFSAIP